MSLHRALKTGCLAVVVLTLLLAGIESRSYGGANLPQTPCPCAADGVCRPVTPWGYSQTRWRSWPGEPTGQPTPADAALGDQADEQGLDPYELPLPQHEDLRGPAKDRTKKSDHEADPEADNKAAEAPLGDGLLPGPEALPAFDPQGNQLELPGIPGMDDAPPALPTSLQQAALRHQSPAFIMPKLSTQPQPVAAQPIRQASWQPPSSIQLINPASAIVVEPGTSALQQAIYYEASDLDNALVE